MAPVASKLSKRSGLGQEDDLVGLAVRQVVRPALDALLEVLRAGADFCGEALVEVGTFVETTAKEASRLLSTCCSLPSSFARCLPGGGGRSLQSELPIMFVLEILVLLYGAFVFCYMPSAGLALNSPTSLIFHALIFMIISSLAQAVGTDPGTVPDTPKWRCHGKPPEELKDRKRKTGEARWCQWTQSYKPDRAHYCRVEQRVVLRMDHHCPWIRNTVGFHNHKFFFLFLMYTTAACSFLGIGILQLLVQTTLPAINQFLLIGAEGLASLLLGVLGPFFSFHCWLLANNMTTIEFCESRNRPAYGEAQPTSYDLGIWRNLSSVLGSNPLLWFLPVGGPSGDGVSYDRRVLDGTEADPRPPALARLEEEKAEAVAEEQEDGEWETEAEGTEEEAEEEASECEDEEAALKEASAESSVSRIGRSIVDVVDDFRVGCEHIGASTSGFFRQTRGESMQERLQFFGETLCDAKVRFLSCCTPKGDAPTRRVSHPGTAAMGADMAAIAAAGGDAAIRKKSSGKRTSQASTTASTASGSPWEEGGSSTASWGD